MIYVARASGTVTRIFRGGYNAERMLPGFSLLLLSKRLSYFHCGALLYRLSNVYEESLEKYPLVMTSITSFPLLKMEGERGPEERRDYGYQVTNGILWHGG